MFGVAAPLVAGVFVAVCTLESELEEEEFEEDRSERMARRK